MTDVDEIRKKLEGRKLLGFMPLTDKQYTKRDWQDAIALYLDDLKKPTVVVLITYNQDYSMYDNWTIEDSEYIKRNDKYKAIGEKIKTVTELKIEEWTAEKDQIQFTIQTKTKILRFGHHWNDCHYPSSIWDEGEEQKGV